MKKIRFALFATAGTIALCLCFYLFAAVLLRAESANAEAVKMRDIKAAEDTILQNEEKIDALQPYIDEYNALLESNEAQQDVLYRHQYQFDFDAGNAVPIAEDPLDSSLQDLRQ